MKITPFVWDFIEIYLPDYYHRDDVLRQSELQLFIDGHESRITGLTCEEAESELNGLILRFCLEAIEIYMETKKSISHEL